jgi:hypothetical protein
VLESEVEPWHEYTKAIASDFERSVWQKGTVYEEDEMVTMAAEDC